MMMFSTAPTTNSSATTAATTTTPFDTSNDNDCHPYDDPRNTHEDDGTVGDNDDKNDNTTPYYYSWDDPTNEAADILSSMNQVVAQNNEQQDKQDVTTAASFAVATDLDADMDVDGDAVQETFASFSAEVSVSTAATTTAMSPESLTTNVLPRDSRGHAAPRPHSPPPATATAAPREEDQTTRPAAAAPLYMAAIEADSKYLRVAVCQTHPIPKTVRRTRIRMTTACANVGNRRTSSSATSGGTRALEECVAFLQKYRPTSAQGGGYHAIGLSTPSKRCISARNRGGKFFASFVESFYLKAQRYAQLHPSRCTVTDRSNSKTVSILVRVVPPSSSTANPTPTATDNNLRDASDSTVTTSTSRCTSTSSLLSHSVSLEQIFPAASDRTATATKRNSKRVKRGISWFFE